MEYRRLPSRRGERRDGRIKETDPEDQELPGHNVESCWSTHRDTHFIHPQFI
jgi:hypothetical protein